MSMPTGSDESQANESEAARLSRASAISSFERRVVPLASSPAVTDATSRRSGGANSGPASSEPESASVGLKWFSRT
jgi:hypothetical protein